MFRALLDVHVWEAEEVRVLNSIGQVNVVNRHRKRPFNVRLFFEGDHFPLLPIPIYRFADYMVEHHAGWIVHDFVSARITEEALWQSIQSGRFNGNPRNLAGAMAGLPELRGKRAR